MANPTPTPPLPTPPGLTPITATTKRGFATASFSFGLWGTLVFWWYPFGMAIAALGVVFGLISLALGIKAGKDGENLALYGVGLGVVGVSLAVAIYRFMMVAFEGTTGWEWLAFNLY